MNEWAQYGLGAAVIVTLALVGAAFRIIVDRRKLERERAQLLDPADFAKKYHDTVVRLHKAGYGSNLTMVGAWEEMPKANRVLLIAAARDFIGEHNVRSD